MHETLKFIKQNKIIAILRGIPEEKIINVANALYDGGIRVIEIPFTDDTKTARSIKLLNDTLGEKMLIGAGTVLNLTQLKLSMENGAKFIVSPNINAEIVKETKKANLVSIPGALTPTEVAACIENGADIIKLFPAGVMGASYFKQVKAPFCNVCMFAFGGIKPADIKSFITSGADGFGISSGIVDAPLLESENYKQITENAEKYVKAI